MKTINPSIFKAYDIRGVYPTDINDENISSIVSAIYTFFLKTIKKDPVTIILSRDMRVSSPSLHKITQETLLSLGAQIIDLGISPTTSFYFAVSSHKADCGIQISASHNPKEYNGLKLVKRDGEKIIKIGKGIGMEDIKEIALNGTFVEKKVGGSVKNIDNIVLEEVEAAFSSVKPTYLSKIKVVADAANSLGSLYLNELVKQTPVELVRMNFDLDGTFPVHQADPLQFKLFKDLQKKVLDEKADLGIMPDGDGDRIFFVDEKGQIIPATLISSLVASELLQTNPAETILVDIRYTRNVESAVTKLGGKISLSRVGHALITDQLNREHALFAGESSGHFYFRETGGAESAIRVVLYVLNVIGREKKPFSEIIEKYHTSIESGEKNFELPEEVTAQKITDTIISSYPDGKVDTLDGIAVDFPDWRFSIRSSNTEPLLRLNVEGLNKSIVDEKMKELEKQIRSFGATVKE